MRILARAAASRNTRVGAPPMILNNPQIGSHANRFFAPFFANKKKTHAIYKKNKSGKAVMGGTVRQDKNWSQNKKFTKEIQATKIRMRFVCLGFFCESLIMGAILAPAYGPPHDGLAAFVFCLTIACPFFM